jgi:pimeloyl-ACP methyl ester carboxylesterase
MSQIRQSKLFAVLALSAAPPFLSAQEPKLPPDVKKVAVADGVELHYLEKGKGVPIIFVHASPIDCTSYERHLGPLAESYRAIAYSRPYNYPNTNKFQPRYSYEIEADYLATLIKKLGLEKAHIVGHSNGGNVALCLGIKHPELVRTLILAEPGVQFKGDPVDETLALGAKKIRELFEQGKPEEAVKAFFAWDQAQWDKLPEDRRKLFLRNARALEAVFVKSEPTEVDREDVKKLAMPTLFLSGEVTEKSLPYLKRITKEMMELIPEKSRQEVVIPGAHHGIILSHAEQSRKALLEFLKDK